MADPIWTPTVAQVAALLARRTLTRLSGGGQEVGTFNNDTVPTGDTVELLITEAVSEVSSAVGVSICWLPNETDHSALGVLHKAAREVARLLTAMNIELSYFPEQIQGGHSSYEALERRYNSSLKRLTEAVGEACGGGGDGGDSVITSGNMPNWSYPQDQGGMVGWQTRFD